jgi:hypothetical protein
MLLLAVSKISCSLLHFHSGIAFIMINDFHSSALPREQEESNVTL